MSSPVAEASPPSRIALVGIGLNSYTNPSVAAGLRRVFPDYEIDWIDLRKLVKTRTHHLVKLFTVAHAVLEFGQSVLLHPGRLGRRAAWTTFLFRLRSRIAHEQIARRRYLFSMQIQSTFDASTPGLPHFVYTDNTVLANTHYKDSQRSQVPVTDEWLELERQIYHNAEKCFVMSQNVGRSMIEDYGCEPEKVVCAYGGPNASIADVKNKRYDQKNILFVGTVWDRKGGPELLAAFRLVRTQIPDATLTVVGCSPEIDEPGCHIVGRVQPSELATYYRNASVFCMPSRLEPFGIVYIEAMAHRMPVVVTDIAATPDFVTNGENGFRVEPYDTKGLADSLIKILGNPELAARMGERSYAVSRTYTWDNTAAIMRDAIEQVISGDLPR
jgi:glycosyltransferase involved in cell wall biosynthesis